MTTIREYERTHPWIDFSVDLRQAPIEFWMLLGEAKSKVDHIAGVPLKPKLAQDLHSLYLAKGALATTAIEGNTLSEGDALRVVQGTADLPPSKEYLRREIQNIVDACNHMLREIASGSLAPLSPELICEYNRKVLHELEFGDPQIVPGEIRQYSVGVGRYRAAPAADCRYLLERLCEWLNSLAFDPPNPAWSLAYAVIKAVVAHLYIAWIHPFGDGNGRTARLVEFRILVSAGFPVPAAHILSDHYNQTRAEYYRRLEQSSLSGGNELRFLAYAAQGLVDGLHGQLQQIQHQQISVMWHDYVYEMLNEPGAVAHRRRELVFALTHVEAPIAFEQILSQPKLASAYRGRTNRTLSRDLSALTASELLVRTKAGYQANIGSLLAFLPMRHLPQRRADEPASSK